MTRERRATPGTVHRNAWFPGHVIGGVALVVGPVVWFAGLLLRHLILHSGTFTSEQLARFGEQPFAAPAQLAAYARDPALVTAGYAVFCAGAVLLCPAIITLARVIATRCPGLAFWGAGLFVLGLFSRLYFTGVEQTLFQLTGRLGLEQTTGVAMDTYVDISYGPWLVPVLCSAGAYPGTLLLAVGAYRSGTFGPGPVPSGARVGDAVGRSAQGEPSLRRRRGRPRLPRVRPSRLPGAARPPSGRPDVDGAGRPRTAAALQLVTGPPTLGSVVDTSWVWSLRDRLAPRVPPALAFCAAFFPVVSGSRYLQNLLQLSLVHDYVLAAVVGLLAASGVAVAPRRVWPLLTTFDLDDYVTPPCGWERPDSC
ncbi:hypothetical protein ACSDR0_29250 [Streptosporangium sp. G11]|uniref:hypothetical protein n=1 Tax=Streptosporangium sp. G11 TaxID=3436926 RepID=UPI003EBDD1F7